MDARKPPAKKAAPRKLAAKKALAKKLAPKLAVAVAKEALGCNGKADFAQIALAVVEHVAGAPPAKPSMKS
jgi:hypothetical protein